MTRHILMAVIAVTLVASVSFSASGDKVKYVDDNVFRTYTGAHTLTLGTANGLSLSGSTLSLQTATDNVPGAMSAADHGKLTTALQPTGDGSHLTGVTTTLTLPQIIAAELAATPRRVYWVYGDSTDGGTTPESAVLTDVATLEAAGVPAANIKWLYRVASGANTFTVNSLTSTSSMDSVTITQAGGTFAVAGLTSSSSMDSITIVNPGALILAIADLSAPSSIDGLLTLALAGGTLATADMASATSMDGPITLTAGVSYDVTDFESSNMNGWVFSSGNNGGGGTNTTGALSSTQAHGGTASYKFTLGDYNDYVDGGATPGTLTKTYNVASGNVSFWVYTDDPTGFSTYIIIGGTTSSVVTGTNGSWQLVTIAAPATGSKTVVITASSNSTTTGGHYIWIDDISVPHN